MSLLGLQWSKARASKLLVRFATVTIVKRSPREGRLGSSPVQACRGASTVSVHDKSSGSYSSDRVQTSPRLSRLPQQLVVFKQSSRSDSPFSSLSTASVSYGARKFPSLSKMHSYAQIISSPTADTPGTCVLLHFDNRDYLVGNASEGTQRALTERGVRLTRLSNVFLTGKTDWRSLGGVVGLILSVADSSTTAYMALAEHERERDEKLEERLAAAQGERKSRNLEQLLKQKAQRQSDGKDQEAERPSLSLHGGKNFTHLLATARKFIFRRGMDININEWTEFRKERPTEGIPEPSWSDDQMKVWQMTVLPKSVNEEQFPVSKGTQSPRKRTINELEGIANGEGTDWSLDQGDRDFQMRKAVVSEMFNSSWRLDSLTESPLSQVRLPAKLFQRNAETGHIEPYSGPLPGPHGPTQESLSHVKVLVRKPWPGAMIESLPPTRPSNGSICYILKNRYQRGRFLPQKAKELGVEDVKKFSMLAKGESVEIADGKVVTPDQVMTPGREGNGIVVAELPSVEYIEDFLGRPEWKNESLMNGVQAFIWILGAGVAKDSQLQQFMHTRPQLQHVVSSSDTCANSLSFHSCAASTIRLHQIDPERHAIPVHDNTALNNISTLQTEEPKSGPITLPSSIQPAKRGHTMRLEPSFEIKPDEVIPLLHTGKVVRQTSKRVLSLAQSAQEYVTSPEFKANLEKHEEHLPGRDVEIYALGTGSALPSKYRNVSSTLVRVPGYGSYLFDCGENTLGQLRRRFPLEKLEEILRDLKAIWISHLHADHHLGTVSVIRAWHDLTHSTSTSENVSESKVQQMNEYESTKQLFVIAEQGMQQFLREYADVEPFGHKHIIPLIVSGAKPSFDKPSTVYWDNFDLATQPELLAAVYSNLGISDIQAVYVTHCHGARAVSITFPNGFKFSYSGDCRPSMDFAKIGLDSTVLLHEATFDDELAGDAKAKNHSTTSEAIGVGLAMKARRILLTHFSQRYQKIPVMRHGSTGEDDREAAEALPPLGVETSEKAAGDDATADVKVGVAFDYMGVKVGQISELEHFTPALSQLFEADSDDEGRGSSRSGSRDASIEKNAKGTDNNGSIGKSKARKEQRKEKKERKKERRESHRQG